MHAPFLRRRLAASLLCVALVAAACGGGGDDESTGDTTTTANESSGTSMTTEGDPEAVPTQPLTGLPLESDELLDQPALVVKYGNNELRSQPHVGINDADVVFEELIEGSATRFAAVFHSTYPLFVGPVRSARTTDLSLMANLNSPILVYSGANGFTQGALRDAEAAGQVTLVMDRAVPPFSRADDRSAPMNLFADVTAVLDEFTPENAAAPDPLFTHGDAFEGQEAAGVRLEDTRFRPAFVWDPEAEVYTRYSEDAPHLADGGDVAVTTDNVVVLFANYIQSPADPATPEAETIGGGEAWILRDGQAVVGSWARPFAPAPYVLSDADGEPVDLVPGRTWVMLVRVGQAVQISDVEAESLLALPVGESGGE